MLVSVLRCCLVEYSIATACARNVAEIFSPKYDDLNKFVTVNVVTVTVVYSLKMFHMGLAEKQVSRDDQHGCVIS